jgi:hypothetical protein
MGKRATSNYFRLRNAGNGAFWENISVGEGDILKAILTI